MIIVDRRKNDTTTFGNLKIGTTFMWGGIVFEKIADTKTEHGVVNSYNFESYLLACFNDDEIITKVKTTLLIDDVD